MEYVYTAGTLRWGGLAKICERENEEFLGSTKQSFSRFSRQTQIEDLEHYQTLSQTPIQPAMCALKACDRFLDQFRRGHVKISQDGLSQQNSLLRNLKLLISEQSCSSAIALRKGIVIVPTQERMSQFRAKKLDIGSFINIRNIRDHTKRKVFAEHEPER
jgi:hypothetical protein